MYYNCYLLTLSPVVAAVKQKSEPLYLPIVTLPGNIWYFNCKVNIGMAIPLNLDDLGLNIPIR